ncbi:MAG TPA: lipocalin [Paracoccaceae bacterium]|nr:lipocalin [Paracoccaceae bacterium]
MPRLTALALLLVLAACAAPGAFRDTRTPIFSAAAFDPAAITGDWTQAAAFLPPGAACRAGQVQIAPGRIDGRLCVPGGDTALAGPLVPVGPGRLRPPQGPVWWVIWADTDLRTLAIGTPDGSFGTILVRRGGLSDDRLRAAAEIFDFNGYDTARLTRQSP